MHHARRGSCQIHSHVLIRRKVHMFTAELVSELQTHTPGSRYNSRLVQLLNVLPFQGEAIVL